MSSPKERMRTHMLTTNYIESLLPYKRAIKCGNQNIENVYDSREILLYERYVLQNAIQYCIISSKEGD